LALPSSPEARVSEGVGDEEPGGGDLTLPLDPGTTGPASETATPSGRDVLRVQRRHRHRGRTAATYGVIFAGGMVGGTLRYVLEEVFPEPERGFPVTTFVINVGGAFALALLLVLVAEALDPGPYVRPALGTGLLGSFTTFSTFVVAADRLVLLDRWWVAAGYVLGSAVAGLAAASFGLVIGRGVVTLHGTRTG
jgi:fluoride exporter